MAAFNDVEWLDTAINNNTDRYWDGVCGWATEVPETGMAVHYAELLATNCRQTFERLVPAVSLWNQLREVYGGEDQDTLFAAMDPVLERLVAIKRAGEAFQVAVETYHYLLTGMEEHKDEYDTWAGPWLDLWRQLEPDTHNLSTEEFEAKYIVDPGTARRNMEEKRRAMELSYPVRNYLCVDVARRDVVDLLQAIDMDELGTMEYSQQPEALNPMDSVAEIMDMLKDSHVFGDSGLTEAQYRQLALEIYRSLDNLPADYTDENGISWSFGPDGELVRSGTVMDPNLTAATLLALGRNPDLNDLDIDGLGLDGQTVGEFLAEKGITSGGTKLMLDSAVARGTIAGLAASVVNLIGMGLDAQEHEKQMEQNLPLLSAQDAADRQGEYVRNQVLHETVNAAGGAGTAVLTYTMGPLGTVIGATVTTLADQITTVLIDKTSDETWTREEMLEAYRNGEFS